jgi:hypothetical protein
MSRLLLAVAAFTLALASPAQDDKAAKYVRLVHADTGKVLAVADDSDESGTRTVLAKEDAKNQAQQWKLEKDGQHLKIVNRKSGKVLDVYEDSRDEGTQIIIWDEKPEGFDNQRWAWVGDAKERRLKSKSSELVLDVGADGQVIQKKADDKAKGQLWRVVEAKE